MTVEGRGRAASTLWIVLLTAAGVTTTLVLACATPFAALAALAATRMRARDGLILMALVWLASQAVGFCVLGYPRDPVTLAWGAALLSAALAAVAAARWGARQAGERDLFALATGFGAGFVAYKLVLLGWSFVLGGVHVAASPYWTARQFGQEALILAALALLARGLAGLASAVRQRRAAASA